MNNTVTPIEQYYLDKFFETHKELLSNAVVVKNSADIELLKDNSVDVMVAPRLLNSVYEYESTLKNLARVLKPHGTLVCALTSVALPADSKERLWGFTIASVKYIFGKYFKDGSYTIENYGNALAGRLSLEGVSVSKVSHFKLDQADPFFPVIIGIKAIKN